MSLSRTEKAAGRVFREQAEEALAAAWQDRPRAAPCSPRVSFFRHECAAVKGRTRAISLSGRTLTSPEAWVAWDGEELRAFGHEELAARAAAGDAAEYEIIMAGKFTFTWKYGRCGRCGLEVMSREGILQDARPHRPQRQGDLASFAGSQPGSRREEEG